MPRLPNVELAIVADAKITNYLLDPTHEFGGPKARFFERFGFSADAWHELRDALIAHARQHDVALSSQERHGVVYEIIGPLQSPDGRNPLVMVVWMIRHGEDRPRLVTAVPHRRDRP